MIFIPPSFSTYTDIARPQTTCGDWHHPAGRLMSVAQVKPKLCYAKMQENQAQIGTEVTRLTLVNV